MGQIHDMKSKQLQNKILSIFSNQTLCYDVLTSVSTLIIGIAILSTISLFHIQFNILDWIATLGQPFRISASLMFGHFLIVQFISYPARKIIIQKIKNPYSRYILSGRAILIFYAFITYINCEAIFYDELSANNAWLKYTLVANAGTLIGKYVFCWISLHWISCWFWQNKLIKINSI